ncbi:MAG: hypothetical protein KIT84_23820 [Labilithrix sp.]|nr:hypothetical protein [Labilithrix sp.]MCW5814077.1 hypothetical protein [Labilithrix sp.]
MTMRALGVAIGWLAGSVLRVRRAHVEAAMVRAGVADAKGTAVRMYRALGVALVAFLRGRPLPAIDEEPLAAAIARGPVVLFASHTGNWELAAAAAARLLAARGRRLSVVAKPMSTRWIDRLLARLRARLGVHVIAPEGALAAAGRALAAGDVVAMPIDQVPDRPGLAVRFLGARAVVDRAPAIVAWRSRATVLVIGATEGRASVLDVIPARSCSDRAGLWIDAAARRATAALEDFVRREPASWMWLHRRWRDLSPLAAQANRGPWKTRSSSRAGASAAG